MGSAAVRPQSLDVMPIYIRNAAAVWGVPEEPVPVYHTDGHSRPLNTSRFWEAEHSESESDEGEDCYGVAKSQAA